MGVSVFSGHIFLLVLVLGICIVAVCDACISACQCTYMGSARRQRGRKVDCSKHPPPFSSLASIDFPPDTINLDLSYNSLGILKRGSFIQLSGLQRLNLSHNQIEIIEPGAFEGLQSLKRLDLSYNLISNINSSMFNGLHKLEKLFLSENHIATVPDGTFNYLTSLKRFEFNSPHLRCDCHLKWILKWSKTRGVRIPSSTVCALPEKMQGLPLGRLKRKDLHCDHSIDLPIFNIRPSESQLVFKGDKLPFECHASVTQGHRKIAWYRGGQLVTTNKSMGVYVHTSYNLDNTIINHRLIVESLDSSHEGEWSCVVTTASGNLTKKVHIQVRTLDNVFKCPFATNRTSKGVYVWKETMAGLLVSERCASGGENAMATHQCGVDGRWRNLNTSQCSYVREVTRRLSQFASMESKNVDIPSLLYGINVAFQMAIKRGEVLDSLDVFYVADIMETLLLPHASKSEQVQAMMLKLASNMTILPAEVLRDAQIESKSASRITHAMEKMLGLITPRSSSGWRKRSENIIAVVHSKKQIMQDGLTCALLDTDKENEDDEEEMGRTDLTDSSFTCGQAAEGQVGIASFHIPPLPPKEQPTTSRHSPTSRTTSVVNVDTTPVVTTEPNTPDNQNSSIENENTTVTLGLPPQSSIKPATVSTAPIHNSKRFRRDTDFDWDDKGDLLNPAKVFPSLQPSKDHLFRNLSGLGKILPPSFDPSKLSKLASSFNVSSKNIFPFSKFSSKGLWLSAPSRPHNVFVIVYGNGRLFPILQSGDKPTAFHQDSWAVVTPIIAISIGNNKKNLSEPVVLSFTVEDTRKPLKAAYFDDQETDGYGVWRLDGCEIVQKNGSLITVHVHHLSAFALLQDLSYTPRLAAFPMEPVIYVGSGVCALCMIIVIATYISCFGSIGVPKKIKHSVVNVCLATLFLMAAFALGINRTALERPCQVFGICIHYLTLCAIFWITIMSNIMYKKFIKADRPPEPPPELVQMPLPPKPILQFYFVGYGVPIIICGITGAVNLNFYAGLKYCFLEWEPSLGAFYAPVTLLVAWNLVLFMRISCVVRSVSESNSEAVNDSDDNEIHTNEIELVPSQPDTTTTTHNITTCNNLGNNISSNHRRRYSRASNDSEEDAVSIVSIPDQERRPITQLRSLVAILFLFIVMWMCGALAIAKPFHLIIPHQELIFSYLYGLMSSLFGIFMLVYFLMTRKDSTLSWKRTFGCAPPESYSVPVEVTEPQPEPPPPPSPQTQPVANGSAVKSNSNTNLSVYSQKSSNLTKAYNMKNNSKRSNINLIMPNSSETSFGSGQENYPNFYNPRQNGAAKKFWQKNRQQSKVMNKDINRDLNSSQTDNSAVDFNHHRLSHGTSSDANTHLSIEIQIQPKEPGSKSMPFCGSREIPVHINNPSKNDSHPYKLQGSSCGAVSLEHNNQATLSDTGVNGVSSSSPDKRSSPAGSNSHLPQQRSPSSGSIGGGDHASAFTPVQPRINAGGVPQNLPEGGGTEGSVQHDRSGKEGTPPKNQLSGPPYMAQDSDRQPSNGEILSRPVNPGVAWNPFHCNLPPLSSHPNVYPFNGPPQYHQLQHPQQHPQQQQQQQHQHYPFDFSQYPPTAIQLHNHPFNLNPSQSPTPLMVPAMPMPPPNFNIPPSPYLIQSQSQTKSMSPVSGSSHSGRHIRVGSNGWRPLSGGDSSDSSRPRQRRTNSGGTPGRSGNSPGRIMTTTNAPYSPVMSDSQAYESRYQNPDANSNIEKARSMDSDHHSDPTHRKRHNRADRLLKNKLTNKQRSLGWEDHAREHQPKINYVYVNHMYRDKVMHKLIKQASESDELASKAFWLPRSASEYERLTQKGFCNMAEDSSSSSDEDDSLDNVWIPRRTGNDFKKKETSV